MTLRIRPADLDADRPGLIGLLSRNLPRVTDDLTFDWLYRQNPHGPARVWVATRAADGEFVGAVAAFPRRLRVGSRVETGWVLGDFCVDEGYRALGPALALQRACLAALDGSTAVCAYDFPSAIMTAVYRRLGIPTFGSLVRLARVLRLERVLSRSFPAGLATLLARPFGRLVVPRRQDRPGGLEVSVGDWDTEELSDLTRRVAGAYPVYVERDADYLRWRWARNPLVRAEFMGLRRRGELLGYAVFACHADTATILDIFGRNDAGLAEDLAGAVAEHLRARGTAVVSLPLLDRHPWVARFQRSGFRPRESHPVVLCTAPGWAAIRDQGWFLTYGDRDS